MKKIVPANPNIVIRTCGCMGVNKCDHRQTFDQTVIAWIIYTDQDAIDKESEGSIYVEAVTTLDAMEDIQMRSGIASKILIDGADAEKILIDGEDC
jgi:hypothetical protein